MLPVLAMWICTFKHPHLHVFPAFVDGCRPPVAVVGALFVAELAWSPARRSAGIHPLVSVTPRPVRHARLVAALLKALALIQHTLERVPLLTGHPDATSQLLSLLPERYDAVAGR